jgi:cobalt-zinc-cadmium efflux system outer membrane protein
LKRIDPNRRQEWRLRQLFGLLLAWCVSGCATVSLDECHQCVRRELTGRVGYDVGPGRCADDVAIPPFVSLDDGLSEDEAIALALWNNPDLHTSLARLGIARGDLVQAGLLTNPQFNFLFPGGSKQLEWTLNIPIEALLVRGRRIEIAEQDYHQVANELVQNGLNVARDARLAYADLVLASESARLANEVRSLRQQIVEFSERRLAAGDITGLDVVNARVDAQRAEADAGARAHDVVLAAERLRNILGLSLVSVELFPSDLWSPVVPDIETEFLVGEALNSRPDVLAARFGVVAANKRADLAHWAFMRVDAVLDANHGGDGPSNFGPGFRIDIPIFNRNEGGILRADWTVDQALHNEAAIEQRVAMEVRTAAVQLQQAAENLAYLEANVLPSVDESLDLATTAFEDGGTSYLFVLQSMTQYLDVQAQELQLAANVRRALAELERSVGRRLAFPSPTEPSQIEQIEMPPLPLESETSPPGEAAEEVVSGPETQQNENAGSLPASAQFYGGEDHEPLATTSATSLANSDAESLASEPIAPKATSQGVSWWEESAEPVSTTSTDGIPTPTGTTMPSANEYRTRRFTDDVLGWGSELYARRRAQRR